MKPGKHYKRKPGDAEIRILPDGRVVVVAPDQKMLELARKLAQQGSENSDEVKDNGKAG
jgi:hypothetical protein